MAWSAGMKHERMKIEPYDGLGTWLEKAEHIGEIRRIKAEVDPYLEMATIACLAQHEVGGPAILFENIKGHPGQRALFNPFGTSVNRLALALREVPDKSALDLVKILKEKSKTRIPPKVTPAAAAAVNQNIDRGDKVDVTKFPAPHFWPLDGGRYIGTCDSIISRDPESGRVNLGTYRQMVKSKNEVGYYASPGKDTKLDREAWWAMGKPAPVAAVYGLDPLEFMISSTSYPKTQSEYDYWGGVNGAAIEVFESDVTGLLLPANAEIIAEGWSYPDDVFHEGPFGEFTGYYGRPGGPAPYFKVEAVRYKNNPILTCHLNLMEDWPANSEFMMSVLRSAALWNNLDALGVVGLKGVWCPPEATSMGMNVVSIEQKYAGHAAQVMALAAQCTGAAYFSKYIVVVDDDVDPTNLARVVWAMITRSRPAQSIDILRETWSTYLDPSQNPPEIRPWGSKCLINACMEFKYIKQYAKRLKLAKPVYENVAMRWAELGFVGPVPKIHSFETSDKLTGH
jgi:UbiD family decarboxylase